MRPWEIPQRSKPAALPIPLPDTAKTQVALLVQMDLHRGVEAAGWAFVWYWRRLWLVVLHIGYIGLQWPVKTVYSCPPTPNSCPKTTNFTGIQSAKIHQYWFNCDNHFRIPKHHGITYHFIAPLKLPLSQCDLHIGWRHLNLENPSHFFTAKNHMHSGSKGILRCRTSKRCKWTTTERPTKCEQMPLILLLSVADTSKV